MAFEVHMLQKNLNDEKVEVVEYKQAAPMGDRILFIVEINIQRLASGETGAQVRKMAFIFNSKEQAVLFQQAIMEVESVV